jgi:hypothetical protein
VDFQVTVTGATLDDGSPDDRSIFPVPQTTADGSGNFSGFIVEPSGFSPVVFDGSVVSVIQFERIAVVAKNQNVGSFAPGPGVSNIVTLTAPSTV